MCPGGRALRRLTALSLPLLYTYETRLRGWRGAAGFLLLDLLPALVIARLLVGSAATAAVGCLFFGFLAIYEVGYIANDRLDAGTGGDGDRLGGEHVPPALALVWPRLAVTLGFAALARAVFAPVSLFRFLVLGFGVLLLLLLHSSGAVRRSGYLRLGTFAGLAFWKNVVLLAPVLSWPAAAGCGALIFLYYGFPRSLAYALRKFGAPGTHAAAGGAQTVVMAAWMGALAPLAAAFAVSIRGRWLEVVLVLWVLFSSVAAALLLTRHERSAKRRSQALS